MHFWILQDHFWANFQQACLPGENEEKSHILPIFDHALFDRHFWILIIPIIYDKKWGRKRTFLPFFQPRLPFGPVFTETFTPLKMSQKRIFSTHFWSIHYHSMNFLSNFQKILTMIKWLKKLIFYTLLVMIWPVFTNFWPRK